MHRYTDHVRRRQDEHLSLTYRLWGCQVDIEAFDYDDMSASAPGQQQWGHELDES